MPFSKLMKARMTGGLSIRLICFQFDGQPDGEADAPAQLEREREGRGEGQQ